MDDLNIIELYFQRDDRALAESEGKYGGLCRSVAGNILRDRRDCEECVNDTWLTAWNAMPPTRPTILGAFFAKITRNLAVNILRHNTAEKRRGDDCAVCIDELSECIPDGGRIAEDAELKDVLDRFLGGLNEDVRRIFLRRYWYVCPVKQIAEENGMTEAAVKMSLHRTRNKLKDFLKKEGISI